MDPDSLVLQWLIDNKEQFDIVFYSFIKTQKRRLVTNVCNDIMMCIAKSIINLDNVVLSDGRVFKRDGELVMQHTYMKAVFTRRNRQFLSKDLFGLYQVIQEYFTRTKKTTLEDDHPIREYLKRYETIIGKYWIYDKKQYAVGHTCRKLYYVTCTNITTYIDWIFDGEILQSDNIPTPNKKRFYKKVFDEYEMKNGSPSIFYIYNRGEKYLIPITTEPTDQLTKEYTIVDDDSEDEQTNEPSPVIIDKRCRDDNETLEPESKRTQRYDHDNFRNNCQHLTFLLNDFAYASKIVFDFVQLKLKLLAVEQKSPTFVTACKNAVKHLCLKTFEHKINDIASKIDTTSVSTFVVLLDAMNIQIQTDMTNVFPILEKASTVLNSRFVTKNDLQTLRGYIDDYTKAQDDIRIFFD